MLGRRSDQRALFEADHLYGEMVGRGSFYGFLAEQRGELFRDEEFAGLYADRVGRPSVPPSLLATALLLQAHDRVSDEEAKERADYDLRWKVALGIPITERPFAKSTLQVFRAQLVLHEDGQAIFEKSVALARQRGYLRRGKLRVALDTTPILGRGAVKDTYNLLADGIVRVVRVLTGLSGEALKSWAVAHDLGRYFGSSIKGEGEVDWDDAAGRRAFLAGIVADADRLLVMVRRVRGGYPEESSADRGLREAAELLSTLLRQDVERAAEGPELRRGTAKDRIISVHDPEMRHGHKSKQRRFDGYKAGVAVDTASQLFTAVTVLPANAGDAQGALALVEASEQATMAEVETVIGDCAFGGGDLRQQFLEAGRELVAKVPVQVNQGYFTKADFTIDPVARSCTCPAGQTTSLRPGEGRGRLVFRFAAATCTACPLRRECTPGRGAQGRSVALHPQETLLQAARVYQTTAEGHLCFQQRQVVEHRIARLVQLGVRQARYFGSAKTLFQLLLAATVANLTLLASNGDSLLRLVALSLTLITLFLATTVPGRPAGGRPPLRPSSAHLRPSSPQPLTAPFKMALSRPHF